MKRLTLLFFSLSFFSTSLSATPFVKATNLSFEKNANPYFVFGTNLWYGMNLGMEFPLENRPRLLRELDRIKAMGLNNVRIMATSEGPENEPFRVTPALQKNPGAFDETVFQGLDFLLDELKKRDLTAVVCLGNFWHWSGGMAQYVQWVKGGSIPYPPPQTGGDWNTFQNYTAQFYSIPKAIELYKNTVKTVINRTNTISKIKYAEDPTIFAWEIANEPRGLLNYTAYNAWLNNMADFISALDSNHMITTGAEGETPWPLYSGVNFANDHASTNIAYTTAHIWAENWMWFDPYNILGTLTTALFKVKTYLKDHAMKSASLKKPLVLEEFGLARDARLLNPNTSVKTRDQYFAAVFDEILSLKSSGTPVAGVNFWAWSGEGVPQNKHWLPGDPLLGDPAHEPQGWYGVYSSDQSTVDLIKNYARKFNP